MENNPFDNNNQPSLDDIAEKIHKNLKNLGGHEKKLGLLIVIVIIGVWLFTGIYRVQSGHKGIAMLFGKYHTTTNPGLHWFPPVPIGRVYTPNVAQVRRTDIGFRSSAKYGNSGHSESLMITANQNIVDLNFVAYWKISSPKDYLFNIRNVDVIVKAAAESAMREIIGQSQLQVVLTNGKQLIIEKVRSRMQDILNDYKAGVEINNVELLEVNPPSQVIDAFDEVQRARQDKDRMLKEAQAYQNKTLPAAKAAAVTKVREAEAYKNRQIALAQGEADKFTKIYKSYLVSPKITKERLYLETMSKILANQPKAIVSSGNNIVPYMPLPSLKNK